MSEAASALPVSEAVAPRGRWLALWTKPRAEKVAARAMRSLSVPAWLPTYSSRRQWSDRRKVVALPLFPGYLFAQVSPGAWTGVLGAAGVLTVVKQGRDPAWIRDSQIADLRLAVESLGVIEDEPRIESDYVAGDRVQVLDGPLARLIGTVRELRGGRRLLVGIEQIGRAISISIGTASVARIGVSNSSAARSGSPWASSRARS